MTMPFDRHLAVESDRFLDAVLAADPDARVPTCPDWTADDLLWHLGRVQHFWAQVLRHRPQSPEDWHEPPERPGGRRGLRRLYEDATADLRRQLQRATDTEPAWTWHDEQTVGFVRRRQAHEAAIHRVDAELAAGRPMTPIDAGLAGDGILECLAIMDAGVPSWAQFVPDGTTVELAPTDGPDPVRVALGRAVGEDPDGGRLDAPHLAVVPVRGPADATVRATASHLDAWLWHRAEGGVSVEGSRDAFDRFVAVVSSPIS